MPTLVLRCALFGHRIRFAATGSTLSWACSRGCGFAGDKDYPDPATAARYAAALDTPDSADLGRRAPLMGMFPLRLWRLLRRPR